MTLFQLDTCTNEHRKQLKKTVMQIKHKTFWTSVGIARDRAVHMYSFIHSLNYALESRHN